MIPEKRENKKFTYADYLSWPEEERWELIEGEPYNMSPAPASRHQKIVAVLLSEIYFHLKGKPCQVFPAPFDVRLTDADDSGDQDIYNTVQPDLAVICDPSKIDEKGCLGSPDMIVEILSPSTGYRDETEKLTLYEKFGVREYWIVNPDRQTIQVFLHNSSDYEKPVYYKGDESIQGVVLEGFVISLKDIFQE